MSQFDDNNAIGRCANCGKPVSVRDIRQKVSFCNRVCASMAKYRRRYSGVNATKIPQSVIDQKMSKL